MRWSWTGRTIDDALALMRYWDASAIIPLLADEPSRDRLLAYLEQDAEILAWWGTPVEIASAIARREREQLLTPEQAESVLASAHQLAEAWHEIVPSVAVRRSAERLLRMHALRTADSLQLAAALVACDRDPTTLEFVCLDVRLASVARREGFRVLD